MLLKKYGQLVIKFLKKYFVLRLILILFSILIIVLILIPLSVGLGIKYIDYVPFLNKIPGDNGDWLGFWSGYLGSMIGVGGAYYVMKHQLNFEHKKELEEKKSLLIPGVKEYTDLELIDGKDLLNDGRWIKDYQAFSEVTFPLINGGKTPVFDIKYCFEISNFTKFKSLYTNDNMLVEMNPRMFIREESKIDFLYYTYIYEDSKGNGRHKMITLKNLNYLNFSSVIMPGESIDLKMPMVAILLLSYSFSNFMLYSNSSDERMLLPEMVLKINYKDYQLNDQERTFNIGILGHNSSVNNAKYRIAPIDLNIKNLRP